MTRDDDDCVHCPHCDHHLSTWGEMRAIMRSSGRPPHTGAWTCCPCCFAPIKVMADGDHVAPSPGEVAALPEDGKRNLLRLAGVARMKALSRERGDVLH